MAKRKTPNDKTLRKLYLNDMLSSTTIAELHGVTRTTVCKHLKRLKITRPESGPDSRNKKYNREVFKSGYPVLHLPNHPRASAIGYVFKHILEIEKNTGRTPLKTEHIHHVDLDRANYNLENLYHCKGNSAHQQLHASLNKIMGELIKNKTIKFRDGKYCL